MTLKEFNNSILRAKWEAVVASPEFQAAYYLSMENGLRLVERETQISSDKDVHAIGNGKMLGVLSTLDFMKYLGTAVVPQGIAPPEPWGHKGKEAVDKLPELKKRER